MRSVLLATMALILVTAGCGKSAVGVASGGRDVVGQWSIDVELSTGVVDAAFGGPMAQAGDPTLRKQAIEHIGSMVVLEFFEDGRVKFTGGSREGVWHYTSSDVYEVQFKDGEGGMTLGYREERLHHLNPPDPAKTMVFRRATRAGSSTSD